MAIVANGADDGAGAVDQPLTTANRDVSDNPNGVETPQFAGEIVYDQTSDCLWKATDPTNNNWVMLTPAVV